MLQLLAFTLLAYGTLAVPPSCTTSLKSPTPSGFHCGDRGRLLMPTALATSHTATQLACRNACLDVHACKAFSFDGTKCTLYPQGAKQLGFRGGDYNSKYWNRHCFAVTCSCPNGPGSTPLLCAGQCIDPTSDPQNCGSCGDVCPTPTTACTAGACACPIDGQKACGNNCTDTSTDPGNCGSCGYTCSAPTSACSAGACVCPINGQEVCGNSCTDISSDNNNCGSCGTVCMMGTTCQTGKCLCSDGAEEASLQSNSQDCGSCGNVCHSNSICQSGTCACADGSSLSSLPTNVNDCGSCGVQCIGNGAICSGGQCGCSNTANTYCSLGGCIPTVSLQYDSNNCGACGRICAANQICSQGGCAPDPGTCGNRGIQWAYLNNIDGDNNDDTYSQFQPSHYNSGQPIIYCGQIQQIGSWTENSDTIYNTGVQAGTKYYVVNHRGYILAPATGSYTATIGDFIDDIACFWIGSSAYTGYTRSNAVICRAAGIDTFSGPHQATFNMVEGTYYPFRVIYAQAQEDVYFTFDISFTSTGLSLISGTPNSAVPWIITQGCNGSPAPFEPFGQET